MMVLRKVVQSEDGPAYFRSDAAPQDFQCAGMETANEATDADHTRSLTVACLKAELDVGDSLALNATLDLLSDETEWFRISKVKPNAPAGKAISFEVVLEN